MFDRLKSLLQSGKSVSKPITDQLYAVNQKRLDAQKATGNFFGSGGRAILSSIQPTVGMAEPLDAQGRYHPQQFVSRGPGNQAVFSPPPRPNPTFDMRAYNQSAIQNFNTLGKTDRASRWGSMAGSAAPYFIPGANSAVVGAQLGSQLANNAQSGRFFTKDSAKDTGLAALNLIPGIPKGPVTGKIVSPLLRYGANAAIAGTENVLRGQGSSLIETGRPNTDVNSNLEQFAIGAGLHTVMSPREAVAAAKEAAPYVQKGAVNAAKATVDLAHVNGMRNGLGLIEKELPQTKAYRMSDGTTLNAPPEYRQMRLDDVTAFQAMRDGKIDPNLALQKGYKATDSGATLFVDTRTGTVDRAEMVSDRLANRFKKSVAAPKTGAFSLGGNVPQAGNKQSFSNGVDHFDPPSLVEDGQVTAAQNAPQGTLKVGQVVSPSDRNNFGKITKVNADGTYTVRFKGKNGATFTKEFAQTDLKTPTTLKPGTKPESTNRVVQAVQNRLSQDPATLTAGNTERGFVTSVGNSDLADEIKTSTIGTHDKRSTQALADRAVERVSQDQDGLTTYNRLMGKKEGTMTDEDVADAIVYAKQATNGTKAEMKLAADVLTRTAQDLTRAGQTAQAASLLKKMTPEGVLYQIGKISNKKGSRVSADMIEKLVDATQKLKDMPDGRDKNLAIQKLNEQIRDLFPDSAAKQLVSVWKAGLLTGLKTTGINLAANTANTGARIASSPAAAAADTVMSWFTGQRTKTATVAGFWTGDKKGLSEGWDYLIHGYDPGKVSDKADIGSKGTAFSKNIFGKMGKYFSEGVFRFIGAQDRPFYYANMYNSLEDQARAAVKNQKLSGEAKNQFIKDFVNNPDEKAVQQAAADAERAVFQNDTILNRAAQGFKKPLGQFGEVIVPFAKTPSSVITEIASYTPVGPAAEAISQIRAGKFNQRALAEAIGKGVTGTAALALGYELGKAGMVNGSYPTDERKQTQWDAENRKANSLIIGKAQLDLQALGPVGAVIGMGAAAAQEEGIGNKVSAGASQGAKQVVESPWLQGMSNIQDIMSPPAGSTVADRVSKYVTSQAGSVIPTGVSDIAQAFDRAPNGQGNARTAEGPLQGIQTRIPGPWGRSSLPQSYDVLGNPKTTGKNLFQTMVDPTRSQTLNTSPVLSEIGRLEAGGFDASPTKTQKTQKAFGQTISLNKAQIEDLERQTGGEISKRYQAIMQAPGYAELPDEEKSKLLTGIVSEVRQAATKNMVLSNGDTSSALKEDTGSKKAITKEELDLAKYEVESGLKKQVVLGDKVVRLDPDTGQTQVLSKKKIQYDAETKKIDNDLNDLKDEEDIDGWLKLAGEKRKRLVEYGQTLDPELDAPELETLRAKLDTLDESIAKYQGYGGFKKPKKEKAPKFSSYLPTTSYSDTYKSLQALLNSADASPAPKVPAARKVTLIKRKAV